MPASAVMVIDSERRIIERDVLRWGSDGLLKSIIVAARPNSVRTKRKTMESVQGSWTVLVTTSAMLLFKELTYA